MAVFAGRGRRAGCRWSGIGAAPGVTAFSATAAFLAWVPVPAARWAAKPRSPTMYMNPGIVTTGGPAGVGGGRGGGATAAAWATVAGAGVGASGAGAGAGGGVGAMANAGARI